MTKEASIEKLINQEEEHQRELKVLGDEKLRDQAIQYRHGWRRSRRSGSSTSCYREKNRQNFPPRNLNTKNKNCHFYPNAYFSESMVSRSEIWPILVFAVSLKNETLSTRLGVFPSPVPVLCLRPLRRKQLPAEKPGVGAEKGDGGAEGGQECVSYVFGINKKYKHQYLKVVLYQQLFMFEGGRGAAAERARSEAPPGDRRLGRVRSSPAERPGDRVQAGDAGDEGGWRQTTCLLHFGSKWRQELFSELKEWSPNDGVASIF